MLEVTSRCFLLLFNLNFATRKGEQHCSWWWECGAVITANRLLTSSYLTLLTAFRSPFAFVFAFVFGAWGMGHGAWAFGHESGSELSADPNGTTATTTSLMVKKTKRAALRLELCGKLRKCCSTTQVQAEVESGSSEAL